MKVIITGSSGYVGNFLSEHFVGRGWSVVGCDLRPLDRQADLKGFAFHRVDVSDATAVHMRTMTSLRSGRLRSRAYRSSTVFL